MRLNELEKLILIAERDYRAIDDKITFVNLRMKYIRFDKSNPTEQIINYKCQKLLIKKDTYYRKLGEMETKSKVRAQHIIRNLLPELINEHDMLIEDRKELHEMQADAKRADKHLAATRLKLAQIETGRRIFTIKQNIAILMERGHLDTEEATLGEQIRLLTVLQ